MSNKILITSLGWEPRFLSGLEDILSSERPDHIIIFKPSAFFQEITNENKISLTSKLDSLKINHTYFEFNSSNHVEVWNIAIDTLTKLDGDSEFILDITTMPRYLIWTCLHCLDLIKAKFRCIYYPPKSYGEWLSADTGKPQMVFRHSGIAYPDLPTCLFLFSGFDLSRAQHFVDFFEPKKIILITQQGDQLDNNSRCVKQLGGGAEIQTEQLNAYSSTTDLKNQMLELVKGDMDTYNVIATSVGPRPSTLALYMLNRELPSIGLVHANAHQYNQSYSAGIDLSSRFESTIDFTMV